MIQSAVGASPLNGIQRTGLLHDEDSGLIALRIQTVLAQFPFGDIPALTAKRETVFDSADGIGQP
jgi:hypothetical protein